MTGDSEERDTVQQGDGPGMVTKLVAMLILMTGFSAFLLLGAEFFLRFYYRDVLSTADGKSFFSVRSAQLFRDEMNGYRLRGEGFSPKHDGRYRIVAQGDSFTYGQGVHPASKRYTELLQAELEADGFPNGVFVANAGISGHNLGQHRKYLSFIEDIHPDFVLYQWYVNDMDFNPQYGRVKTPHLISNEKVHTWLWQHSAIYYLLQHRYGQFRKSGGEQIPYVDYLVNRFEDPESMFSVKADKRVEALFTGYEKLGLDYGVVLFPSFSQDMKSYKLDFLHERVLRACEAHGVECLDLRDTYRDQVNTDLWANDFDAHPGELAHALAAEAIHSRFGEYWHQQAEKRAANQ